MINHGASMWVLKYAVTAIIMLVISAMANAGLMCTGKINYLGLDHAGQVVLANGAVTINTICSSSSQGNYTINPQACRMFYGALLANQLAGRLVTIYYNDPSLTSCSQIGTWSTQPSAYFIELVN